MAPWISSVLFNHLNAPAILLPSEMEILKKVMTLLKPIEQITKELCMEDVSCSKVIPMVKCLQTCLEYKKLISIIGVTLKKQLLAEMQNRFKDIEIKKTMFCQKQLFLTLASKRCIYNLLLSCKYKETSKPK